MDRRQFLASGSAAGAIGLLPAAVGAQAPGAGDAPLNAAFDRIFADMVANAPELATSLGMD